MYGINNILSSVSESLTPPESLTGYGDKYIVTDLRKRPRKEPNEVKSLSTKSLDIKLFEKAPVKSPYDNDKHVKINVFKYANDDVYYTEIPFFEPTIKKKDVWEGYDTYNRVVVDESKLFDLKNVYSNGWQTSEYTAYVTVDYYAELKKKAIKRQVEINNEKIKEWEDSNKFWKSNSYDKYIKEYKKRIKYLYLYYPSVFADESPAKESAPVESTESEPTPAPEKAQESAPVVSPTPENKQNNNVPVLSIPEIISIARDKVGREFELFDDVVGLESGEKWDLNFNIKAKKIRIFLAYNDWNDNAIKKNIPFWTDDMRPAIFWEKNAESFELVKQLITKEPLKWFVSSYYPPLKDLVEYSFDFDAKDFDLVYWCDNNAEFYHSGFLADISIENFSNLLKRQIRELFDAAIYDKEGNSERNYFIDILLLNDILSYVLKGKKPVNKSFNNVTPDYFRITGTSFDFNNFWGAKIPKKEGLGKPTIKFEFNNNDELKAFLNDNKENLIDSYIDADIADESPLNAKKIAVNGIDGKPPAGIFNCPESQLICNGFVPTYQRLADYSHLIDGAENNNVLKGYGFDDTTLTTLIDAVKNYKQVARLAAHLAADTPAQTAFNIWHFEHCNIKYNYDTPGKEEIRTPARTWLDRKCGVDCDCLAVFTAALLLNLGYKPKFEIVAFANKTQYSHIYVNLDGIAIDRVLPTFNRRPLLITKTMLMDIPVYQLNGLAGINAELQGVYESALRRFAHTQNSEDLLNMRKTQILISLQGTDYNAFRLAGLLMPYIQGIDEDGAYYFDNEEIANIAADADNEIIAAEMRGASDEELNGVFKKIGKALKKAAKKVGSAVKKVAKTTAKAVKTVAKATANTVKAAAKSTANAVKATANVAKAAAQAVTGKGSAAKATLKKAGAQVKAAVVEPVKQATKDTKSVVKNAVVEPTKTAVKVTVVEPTKTLVKAVAKAIKIAGKIFKVILVKINPITVLMRNSLRLLVALNFMGMATRLNVGNMTKDAAIAAGYTAKMWENAKNARDRVIKFFTKMGGNQSKIEKAIVNGSKKKALFKKDYKPNSKIVETGSDDATLSGTGVIMNGIAGLGECVTIASALAAVGAFFVKIWKWICKVVPKGAKAVANVVKKVAQNEDVKKITTAAKDAAVDKAITTIQNKIGGKESANPTADDLPDDFNNTTTTTDGKKWIKYGAIAAAGIAAIALMTSGGKKKKRA